MFIKKYFNLYIFNNLSVFLTNYFHIAKIGCLNYETIKKA